MKKFTLTLTTTAAAALLGSALPAQAQNTGVALGTLAASGQVLVPFSTANFTTPTGTPVPITGAGTTILDVDYFPSNGQLYGFGANGTLYTFDQSPTGAFTGAVTVVAANSGLASTVANIDFNPVANRLRIYTGTNPTASFRLTPDTNTLTSDGNLTFSNPGTPAGDLIGGNAYTNNVVGATATTLYSLDLTTGTLLVNSGTPQFLTLAQVGSAGALGAPFTNRATDNVGFDIAQDGTAYASAGNSLYTVNLTTGTTALVGTQFNPVVNFTTFAITVPEPSTYALAAVGGAAMLLWARRRGGTVRA